MSLATLRQLDDFLGDRWLFPLSTSTRVKGYVPQMSLDMRETENSYEVQVDLPGVDRENIKLSSEGGQLYISAERSATKEKEKDRYFFSERSYGSVSRTIPLPVDADCNSIKAKYDNGVLNISLEKNMDAKRRSIVIQ